MARKVVHVQLPLGCKYRTNHGAKQTSGCTADSLEGSTKKSKEKAQGHLMKMTAILLPETIAYIAG